MGSDIVDVDLIDPPVGATTASDSHAETSAFLSIVAALKNVPLTAHDRVVSAALTFLGSGGSRVAPPKVSLDAVIPVTADVDGDLPRRATIWLAQTNLSIADIDSIFHRSAGGVEIIAHSVSGRSNKEQTRGCYLLAGLKGLLKHGEPRFADDDARVICRDLGCYDRANHATYIKSLGNLITGSKSSSYELTQPGLRAAADLIREMKAM